jgi:hypothetical protein
MNADEGMTRDLGGLRIDGIRENRNAVNGD